MKTIRPASRNPAIPNLIRVGILRPSESVGLRGDGSVLRTLNNSVERMLIAAMGSPQGPKSQSAETHDLNEEGQGGDAADMDAESLQDGGLAVLVPGPEGIHPISGVPQCVILSFRAPMSSSTLRKRRCNLAIKSLPGLMVPYEGQSKSRLTFPQG